MTDQVRTGSDSADPWHGLPSPLDAVSDMRASAKWIVGAAAAVGAVLLGGGPLTAVGKVHGLGSAAAAYVGLVVGLAGVGWAIWHVTDALLPPVTTLATLQSPPLADLRAEIAADPGTFYGPFGTSVGELQAAYLVYGKASANIATMLAIEADSAQHRLLEQGYADATANTAQIQARLRWLLALAHAWRVRDQLRRARSHAFAGAAVAALGAVIFVAATSSQTATGSPHRAPTPAATASRSHR
jgi:hypothetical protein